MTTTRPPFHPQPDRKRIIDRHNVRFVEQHPTNVLTVGNGNLAITVDATGLQTFPDYHELREDPLRVIDDGINGLPEQPVRPFEPDDYQIPLRTQSTWAWYRTDGTRPYTMQETETEYETTRGTVRYPDQMGLLRPEDGIPPELEAPSWLHLNPRRMHLGRLALHLPENLRGRLSLDDFQAVDQELELWSGHVRSRFTLGGEPVSVTTVADPAEDSIAVRIESSLVTEGLGASWIFESQKDELTAYETMPPSLTSWSRLPGGAAGRRTVGSTGYAVTITAEECDFEFVDSNETSAAVVRSRRSDALDVSIHLRPAETPEPDNHRRFMDVARASEEWWAQFWGTGLSVSFEGSTDPRAHELERRVVLSQYLSVVNSAGNTPPQETGLTYNSWGGKFHLEMHWWHAAHFALWGRGDLLCRSLSWYHQILPQARRTAQAQGFRGVRWPKQTDISGQESPSTIGVFLVWQQPHIIHMLELLWRASPSDAFLAEHAELVFETAEFMADFAERRDGQFILPPPLIPAQESYLATRSTLENPTFELAYWQWALNVAAEWKTRLGEETPTTWKDVADNLRKPAVLEDGTYAAISTPPFLIREDHFSMLMAYGFVPPTPLMDPEIIQATLTSVLAKWNMQSTWGWDYPVLALTALRLGDVQTALDALLMDTPKNRYLPNGHNPQMPGFLSIYLPGNGGLLTAIAALAAAVRDGAGMPDGWSITIENPTPALGSFAPAEVNKRG